jgi:hypothetical protein
MKVEPLMWRFFIGLVPLSLHDCISQTPWVCIRSIGEDSSLLLHSLLPPPISILVYAGFLNLLPLLRLVLTIHVASPILILQHPRPYSSGLVPSSFPSA